MRRNCWIAEGTQPFWILPLPPAFVLSLPSTLCSSAIWGARPPSTAGDSKIRSKPHRVGAYRIGLDHDFDDWHVLAAGYAFDPEHTRSSWNYHRRGRFRDLLLGQSVQSFRLGRSAQNLCVSFPHRLNRREYGYGCGKEFF